MIEVTGLTRCYGDFEAVRGLTFSVGDGEILGMLGPNGAGKTTTIRMITGFLPPSSGDVRVAGVSLSEDPVRLRRQIGYLPESVALYPEMRVAELLSYRARLQGLSGARARSQVGEHLERCLLTEVKGQVIGTLSKGYRQRVGLAAALLHDPKVLVLDEPTVGLDPKQIIAIRELIRELGRRRTVLLSTHILQEVELLCSRIQILDDGRIVAEGTPRSLSDQWLGGPVVRLTLQADPLRVDTSERLHGIEGVASVRRDRSAESAGEADWEIVCQPGVDLRAEIFRLAKAEGWTLLGLGQEAVALEDVFVRLTRAQTNRAENERRRDVASEAGAP